MVNRAIILTVIGNAFLAIYVFISRNPLVEPQSVTMPGWVPFIPTLAPLYLAMLPLSWAMPLLIVSQQRFWACVRALSWAFAITVVIWILVPTTLARPEIAPGWWHAPYRVLAALDRPTNIFPCGHILAPVIGTWFLSEEYPRWGLALVLTTLAGPVVIAVSWQHRPQDIVLGAVIAIGAVLVTRLPPAMRRRDQKLQRPSSTT